MKDFKIPQAVAMILLASALATGQDVKPTGGKGANVTPVRAQVEVEKLLREFLSKVDSAAMHERFWADDLVYTSAKGVVRGKAEIVKAVREGEAEAKKPDDPKAAPEPKVTYDAEDIRIRQYGDIATCAFRLVQHTEGHPDTNYRNTGTFILRNGKWQVVAWQATKQEEPVKMEEKKPEGKQ